MRVLYIEDEKYLADAVIYLLKQANILVDWVADGREGYQKAQQPVYDVIILDIMLPSMSGTDILKHLRTHGITTPIIMLSALAEVEDKIAHLEHGADDYLAKPFKTTELIARLHALSRRPPLVNRHQITYQDLTYDVEERKLNGTPLTAKEALLMEALIKSPNQTQHKDHLLARIWGAEAIADDNYVEVYVSYLRKKLKAAGSAVQIKAVRGLGYKLV